MGLKKIGVVLSLLVLGVALPMHAATCSGVVSSLIGTSCTVGVLTFSNFLFFDLGFAGSGSPAGGFQASQLLITPIQPGDDPNFPSGTGLKLTPTVLFFAGSGGNYDFEL